MAQLHVQVHLGKWRGFIVAQLYVGKHLWESYAAIVAQ